MRGIISENLDRGSISLITNLVSNGITSYFQHSSFNSDDVCCTLHITDAIGIPGVGLGTGKLKYNEVNCVGNEEKLDNCDKRGVENTECFNHENDVGVICLDG